MSFFSLKQRFVCVKPILLIATCLLFSGTSASADIPVDAPNWQQRLDSSRIKIYSRPRQGSDFEEFKAVAQINAPLNNIMAVMANPNSCVEWVHGCTVSYGFDELSFNQRHAYSVNDLPWPFRDRDYVLEINTSNDPETGLIEMRMYAVDGKKPASDDKVRVEAAETIYFFRAIDDETTEMVWLQHTEPAGSLPSWLVNALIIDIPLNSILALEETAKLPKYQGQSIMYNARGEIIGVSPAPSK